MKRMFTLATALLGMLAFSGSAFALRPGCDAPPCGGGGGNDPGGGGPPDGESAQNLSVPTIMVGGAAGNLTCGTVEMPSDLIPPAGEPLTGYEVPGYYWIQKVHSWQAQCFHSDATEAAPVQALGNWGDNLEGDAKLKVGAPIRVEIVLTNMDSYSNSTLEGYSVIKLEPSLLDRQSAYGHQAIDESGAWTDNPTDFGEAEWLVHDDGITFSVQNLDTLEYTVLPGTSPMAEINATGKVVYGYNLRVNEQGPYRILFTTTELVEFTGVDAASEIAGLLDEHNAYIDINVVPGGGGGGAQGPKNK